MNIFWLYQAIIAFYFFQVLALIIDAGLSKTLVGLTGENSISYFFIMPITSIIVFFKAIIFIITGISEKTSIVKEINSKNITA